MKEDIRKGEMSSLWTRVNTALADTDAMAIPLPLQQDLDLICPAWEEFYIGLIVRDHFFPDDETLFAEPMLYGYNRLKIYNKMFAEAKGGASVLNSDQSWMINREMCFLPSIDTIGVWDAPDGGNLICYFRVDIHYTDKGHSGLYTLPAGTVLRL